MDGVSSGGAGSARTDAAGVSLTTGTITGLGKVVANIAASGAAFITAAGGTLEINGTISDGADALVLTITGATDTLLLDGVSAADDVSFNGSTGTLELNSAATLTVTDAMGIAGGGGEG